MTLFPVSTQADFIDDALDKYESETDPEDVQIEMLRESLEGQGLGDYDAGSNTVDCSWYDVQCHLQGNFIFTNMVGMVDLGLSLIENVVQGAFVDIFNQETYNLVNGFQVLSTTMGAIFILWHAMRITIMYAGSADEGMSIAQEKIWAIVAIGIMLGVYPQIYGWIVTLITSVNTALLDDNIVGYEMVLALAVNGALYGIIIGLILAVIIIVFTVSLLYRFVLFTLLYVVGVLAIPTMLNDEYNFFKLWLRILVSNFVTLFLQVLCFTLGFNQIASTDMLSMVTGCMFFILALTIPSLLSQFGSSSGTTKAMSSGARTAASVIIRR
jgi:hypothetical protein